MHVKDDYVKSKGDLQSCLATKWHRNEFRIICVENKVLAIRKENLAEEHEINEKGKDIPRRN